MFKKKKTVFSLIFLSIVFLSMIPLPSTHAATFQSYWLDSSATPPTIDGIISAGEWSNAYTKSFTLYQFMNSSFTKSATLWALNDANFLYLRIEWDDSTKAHIVGSTVFSDHIIVHFDENNDDDWETPVGTQNAAKVYFSGSGGTLTASYYDGYGESVIYGSFEKSGESSQDGSGDGSWSSSKYNVEMKLPLKCTDPEDLQPGAGDLISIFILVHDSESSGTNDYYEYPKEGYSLGFDYYNRPNVVSFQLADQPPAKPSTPSPADGATNVSLNATLSVLVSDPDGDSMTVRFYNASDNSLIGTATSIANGTRASITWSGLAANTTHRWYATASDGLSSTKSDTWSFTTGTGDIPGFNLIFCALCIISLLTLIYLGKRLKIMKW